MLNKLQTTVSVENRSLMPNDYATRLTPDEITNIVGFLRMQQGRDQNKIVSQPLADGGVTYQRLMNAKAEPHNWLMYWGDYTGQHYSALTQITPNQRASAQDRLGVSILAVTGARGHPARRRRRDVHDRQRQPATVTAIDARTGRQIWRWTGSRRS